MAKALLGHVGWPDPRSGTELARLRRRVRELETALLRLQAENDALVAATGRDELLTLPESKEPALA